MANRLINSKKPNIHFKGGWWRCGILLEEFGLSPVNAYEKWQAANNLINMEKEIRHSNKNVAKIQ